MLSLPTSWATSQLLSREHTRWPVFDSEWPRPNQLIQLEGMLVLAPAPYYTLMAGKDLNTGKFVAIMMACCVGWRLIAWLSLMIRMREW